jgi:hypothetical protein
VLKYTIDIQHNGMARIKSWWCVCVHNLFNIHLKHLLLADIKAGLFLTLLTLMNAIQSSLIHRQRQVSFDVPSFGDLPSLPAMDGDLPEAHLVSLNISCCRIT